MLAHLPMLIAGRNLPFLRPTVDGKPTSPRERDEFWAQLTNAWLMATTVTLILLAGVRLGFDWRDSHG